MSEFIDLNDSSFDTGDITIFNGGKAGRAENVSLRVEKKEANDTSRSPDWKVYYVDENDGEVNEGYYYLDEKHEKFKTHLKYQGAGLKHLLHAAFGEEVEIPQFKNTKEMLDKCMQKLSSVSEDKKFRVGVTYGTGTRPSAYLRVKPYVPFIEPMSVPVAESRIVFTGDYLMERPEADNEEETVQEFATESVTTSTEEPADLSGFDTPNSDPTSGGEEKDGLPF